MPIFPTAGGGVADREKVVPTVEAIASRLGVSLLSNSGGRAFGGRTFRVTGAQWLVSKGMPLPSIQLLARWGNDVIARYVAETPLDTLSEQYLAIAGRAASTWRTSKENSKMPSLRFISG